MRYPDNERILIVRPCLKAICLGVRSASKLLSVILYRARNCKEDEATFTFTCTQFDLVHDLCEELTTKQLHDMAIPVLQLLGYLDVNGSGFRHTYTVHLDKVQEALSCYKDREKLELLLISFIYKQLEEVPMELELVPIQLEEVLKHLELLLKTIRTSSNSKRGRKPRQEAQSERISENAESNRDITDIRKNKEREGVSANASTPCASFDLSEKDGEEETPLVAGGQFKQVVQHTSSQARVGVHERNDGPATVGIGSEPAASESAKITQAKPKRTRKKPQEVQLTLHEQEIKQWYEELRGVEVSFAKRNVTALQALGKRTMSKDDFLNVTAIL